MNAKTFLKQLEKRDSIIHNKLVEKARLKDIALGITAQTDGERVQSAGSKQKMSDAIDKLVDMEREIDRLVDEYITTKDEINSIIEQLNTAEYDVLHKIYIQGMTFDEVAAVKSKSKSWVTTVHGRALVNVQKILDKGVTENGEN